MKQKEIYLANLNPALGNEQNGIRPVVIVSGNTMNANLKLSIICPISSKIKNYPACIQLNKTPLNGLKEDSEIITFQIRTIAHKRLIKRIGKIDDRQFQSLLSALADILKF